MDLSEYMRIEQEDDPATQEDKRTPSFALVVSIIPVPLALIPRSIPCSRGQSWQRSSAL